MKEKQLSKAELIKTKVDPRFDLSLIYAKEQRVKTSDCKKHKDDDEEKDKSERPKTKKKKTKVKQGEADRQHVTAHSTHSNSFYSASSVAPSTKNVAYVDVPLSSSLRAELAGGSSKKRTTTYTHESDDESENMSLSIDAVLPGTKVKKAKGPAPVSEEFLEAARKLSKNQRRKLESIERRKELEQKVRTCVSLHA